MPSPLSDSDLAVLQGVLDDPVGSIRNVPSAPRSPTTVNLGGGRIQLTVKSNGPADRVTADIAGQVMPGGYTEVASRYPGERVFQVV
jgi:hypothetical protein